MIFIDNSNTHKGKTNMKLNEAKRILESNGYEVESVAPLKQLFKVAQRSFELEYDFSEAYDRRDNAVNLVWTDRQVGEFGGVKRVIIKPTGMRCYTNYEGRNETTEYEWGNDLELGARCIRQYATSIFWGYAGSTPALDKCEI